MEELKELQDQLISKIKEVINTCLTERQREVMIRTYMEQRTQMEVADMLGVCQTTVHKIISGNIDYSNGGRRYGGALKKIKKICETDQEVVQILARLEEIKGLLSET
jgi:predicted transcriptional regulator